MTVQEYLASIRRPLTDIERNFVVDAWNAAKADCQKDIAGWTNAAYEDGGLDMEARCRSQIEEITKKAQRTFDAWIDEKEKNAKYRKALESLLKLLDEWKNQSAQCRPTLIRTIVKNALKEAPNEPSS